MEIKNRQLTGPKYRRRRNLSKTILSPVALSLDFRRFASIIPACFAFACLGDFDFKCLTNQHNRRRWGSPIRIRLRQFCAYLPSLCCRPLRLRQNAPKRAPTEAFAPHQCATLFLPLLRDNSSWTDCSKVVAPTSPIGGNISVAGNGTIRYPTGLDTLKESKKGELDCQLLLNDTALYPLLSFVPKFCWKMRPFLARFGGAFVDVSFGCSPLVLRSNGPVVCPVKKAVRFNDGSTETGATARKEKHKRLRHRKQELVGQ